MIQDLGEKMEAKIEKMQEMFTKDLEGRKNKQTEMNNTLEGINSRRTEAEEQRNDLEGRMVEITAKGQSTEKRMKRTEDRLRDLWDNIKHIHIIGIMEREERKKGPEKIFEEIIAENFLSMGKEIVNQVQETQRVPGRINPRGNTERQIVIKLMKIKDKDKKKILKATREKQQHTKKLSSGYQLISQQKFYKPEGNSMIYLK